VEAIGAVGSLALAVKSRLDGESTVRALFEATLSAFGSVDILINNAGIARFAPISTVTETEFDTTFAVNVKAAFFAFQQAALHMSDGGRIVSISAALTAVGYENSVLYAGTKGALEQSAKPPQRSLANVASWSTLSAQAPQRPNFTSG
jgi:3-oxoacyl-[acyl-carrier protein] reductase